MKKVICVTGAFDPIHPGHLEHIRLARQLGDYLVVIMNPDADLVRKRGGLFIVQSMGARYLELKANKYVDEIVIAIDNDGTVAKTLLMVKPDIFAKGGDRFVNSMPENELEACRKIGCEIVYGVGEILGSSSEIIEHILSFEGKIEHKPSGDFK